MKKIRQELQRTALLHPLPPLTTVVGQTVANARVVVPKEEYEHIPAFGHYLNLGSEQSPEWVMDGRPYMRWNHRTDSYRLTAHSDYTFQIIRIALNEARLQTGAGLWNRFGEIPAKAFARWISQNLTARYGLDINTQIRIAVIAAYYYETLAQGTELDQASREQLATPIAKQLMLKRFEVQEIIAPVGSLLNIKALGQALAEHGQSVRITNIGYVDLFALLGGSWIGVNSREVVAVALEHLPTFIALAYTGLNDRSYRRTPITRLMEGVGRANDLQQFTVTVAKQIDPFLHTS